MKLASTLLATAFVVGSIGFAAAQSSNNPTPPGAQPDKTISSATHCMDKATNKPRLKSATTGAATANAKAGDKSAKSTGTSSQTPQSPGSGKAAMNLSPC